MTRLLTFLNVTIFISVVLNTLTLISGLEPEPIRSIQKSSDVIPKNKNDEPPTLNLSVNTTKENNNVNQTPTVIVNHLSVNNISKDDGNKPQGPKSDHNNSANKPSRPHDIESGAVKRGVLVFVGISMIFMIYVGIKTYRNRRKPNVVVRKYGVRTNRSDLEMRPLPLEDDDEDETVFDLKNVNRV